MAMFSLSSVAISVNHSMSTIPVQKGLKRVSDNGRYVGGTRPSRLSMVLSVGTVVALLLGWIVLLSNAG